MIDDLCYIFFNFRDMKKLIFLFIVPFHFNACQTNDTNDDVVHYRLE